jgi:hypothetical protein
MKRERIYYVEINGTYCGLEANDSIRDVRWNAAQEWGNDNITIVRRATQEDIDNVRGMGGYVPEVKEQHA